MTWKFYSDNIIREPSSKWKYYLFLQIARLMLDVKFFKKLNNILFKNIYRFNTILKKRNNYNKIRILITSGGDIKNSFK